MAGAPTGTRAAAVYLKPGAPPVEEVLHAAIAARASGFLVDTWRKDGRGLLDHLPIERVAALSRSARAARLLFAAAGSLGPDAISRLSGIADVLGVRGAACRGGRSGPVDAERVAELRRRMAADGMLLPAG
jgi:uncharacterized protein (UPF0264 family)